MHTPKKTLIHKIPAGYLLNLPVLLMAVLLASPQSQAETRELSGANASFTGNRSVADGDIYTVDASDGAQPTTFLQASKPDKDTFSLYGVVPDYPATGNSIYYTELFPYRETPDRPDGLASEITTFATPVIFAPSTGSVPGTFNVTGAAVSTFSIASSDAYEGGVRKTDVTSAKWAVVRFGESAVYNADAPFIHVNGAANDVTLDLEHVVFVGAKNTKVTDYTAGAGIIRISPAGATRTVTIKGDVGFVNNLGSANGAAITSLESLVFEGNAFFDGNISGIRVPPSLTGAGGAPSPAPLFTLDKLDGAGGALRMNIDGASLRFKKNVLFSNNVAASEGGALAFGGGSTTNYVVTFDGTATFHGNFAGLIGRLGTNLNDSGNGGALVFISSTNVNTPVSTVTFKDAALFTHNRAANSGGAINNTRRNGANPNAQFFFEKRATFTDNVAGQENRLAEVVLRTSSGNDGILGQMLTYPTYSGTAIDPSGTIYPVSAVIASGGAIAMSGRVEATSRAVFHDETLFARNRALGNGGAIIHIGAAGGIDFGGDATLANNAAGSMAPRSYAGTPDAPTGFVQPKGGAINTQVKLTFSGTVPGSKLAAQGNIAYVSGTHATDPSQPEITGGQGGAIYSYSNAGGLYVDQEYLFDGNQAGGDGGAIYAIGSAKGPDYAGIDRNYAIELTKPGTFTENLAAGNGGAIFATSAIVTSGAVFADNAAAGNGGAIHMDGDASRLTLDAVTGDITFTGNLGGVTTDTSGVDLALVASQTPAGYIAVTPATGFKNDINFGLAASQSGTLVFNAAAGKTILLDGGITQTDTTLAGALVQVTKTGEGMVAFDGASADINAVTTVEAGTLLVLGGAYGHDNATAGTVFTLGSAATLAADGLIQAATININAGATLRAMDGGELVLDAANPIAFDTTFNTAGTGTITPGITAATPRVTINNTGTVCLNVPAPFPGDIVNAGVLAVPAGIDGTLTNNGVFDIGGPSGPPLTVTTLAGSGTLRMTVDLDSASAGVRLVVAGDTSGSHTLEIIPEGTPGGSPLPGDVLANLIEIQGSDNATYGGHFTYDSRTYRIQQDATGALVLDRPRPAITSPDTASGMVAVPFSHTITADGAPTDYAIISGTLPPGLELNGAIISGTPNRSGVSTVTLRVSNANGRDEAQLTITIEPSDHVVTPVVTGTTVIAKVGGTLSYQVLASNDPYSYDATDLPANLAINPASGLISGSLAVSAGMYPAEIVATNIYGTGTGQVIFDIGEVPVVLNSGSFVSGTNGVAFSYHIATQLSASPVDSYAADGLPDGLSVDAETGEISGTPAHYGAYNATLFATNIYGTGSNTEEFRIDIPYGAVPVITSTLFVSGSVGSPFTYQIEATYLPHAFDAGAASLPEGLSVNNTTGVISGTPVWSGTYDTLISATNIYGFGSATLNIAVAGSGSYAPFVLPEITRHPDDATVILGNTATFTVAATGTLLSYQWFKENAPLPTGTAATLTLPGASDADAGSYHVVVSNSFDSIYHFATSNTATLTVITLPDIVWVAGSGSQTVAEGAPVTFEINVNAGTTPLTYKWTRNGALIDNAISTIHALPATVYDTDNGAAFRVEVSNDGGTTALDATLTVIPSAFTLARHFKEKVEASGTATVTVAGPVDLTLVDPVAVASGKTILGAGADATLTGTLAIPKGAKDVVILGLNFTGAALNIAGATDVEISHSTFTDAPVTITGGADNIAFSWNRFAATASGNGSAMRIDGAGADTGILLHHNLWADSLRSDMPAATEARVFMFNNYIAGASAANTNATIAGPGAQILSVDNIYQGVNNPLVAQTGGLLRVLGNYMDGNTGTTSRGEDKVFVPGYSHIMHSAGLDSPGATELALLITGHAGNTAGSSSSTPPITDGSARITATATNDVPPLPDNGIKITANSATMPPLSSFTLTANLAGFTPAPDTLQWYRDNFLITGATNARYTVANALDAPDSGAYAVTMTTPAGETVASGAFTVTVGPLDAPVITAQPVSLTIPVGGRATFAIAVTGGHMAYQWQKDGVDIPGATGGGYGVSTYSITNVGTQHAGSYSVRVTNPLGSETSHAATLTIGAEAAVGGDSGGGGGGAPSLWFLLVLGALAAVRKIKAGWLSFLPALLLAALLAPAQSRAAEYTLSGTYSHEGSKNVANGDIYFVDATPGSEKSSFLVAEPNKDFWVYSLIPNYPTMNDYFLIYKAYLYRYTPDRPSWLAAQIDTWAAPVQIVPVEATGTANVPPPTFRLTGAANTLSIVSSDAYADGKRRLDTDNINWAVLNFNGVYNNSGRFIDIGSITGNDVTLDLEHIIFVGSKSPKTDTSTTTGGSVILNALASASKTLTIKGDVGFVNNMGNSGGAITSTGNLVFEGNVFFDGNIAGIIQPPALAWRDENGLLAEQIDPETGLSKLPTFSFTHNEAAGGSIRLNQAGTKLIFKQTALFTNNVSGGEGGNILLGGGASNGYELRFEGNAAFYGNIAGFIGKTASGGIGGGPGRGGAIYFLLAGEAVANLSTATFKKEAIFVSNRSNNGGGAIGNTQSSANSNVLFTFEGRAIFTDNLTGRENRWELVEIVTTDSLVDYIGEMAKMPDYYGSGGAIATLGSNPANGINFSGEALFARNRAIGSGGAISHLGSTGSITFTENATFTNNAAGSVLIRAGTGTSASTPSLPATSNGGAIISNVWMNFGGSTGGQLLAEGNMAYYSGTGADGEGGEWALVSGNGGAIYSAGAAAGVYIDQEHAFLRNQAGGSGGAIYATGTIKGASFAGAERNYSVELNQAGLFIENLARGNGGAIYANSALVTSGATFENNAAGVFGGAIYVTGAKQHLTLDAATDDITFTGNRSHVEMDETGVDFDLVTSETLTGGYIKASATSGIKNDINFNLSVDQSGTLEFNVGAGQKIYFDGGITHTFTSTSSIGLLQVTKTGEGTVEFDGASADINAVTDVQAGTLRIRDGIYGYSGTEAGSTFTLGSSATLEANGLVRAETININDGATLRVLDGGLLALDSANAVNYAGAVNLAGNGDIRTNATTPLVATSISVGDDGHTQGQGLWLYQDTRNRLNVVFNGSQLSLGLFSGTSDRVYLGALDLGTINNRINLTSLASGNFTLITAVDGITNNTTAFDIYYKGALLPSDHARLTASVTTSGQNVNLNYNAQNTTVTWTGASGDNWNISDAKWTGAGVTDGRYLYGDIIVFDASKSGNVAIAADAAAAGMTVSNNYTFTGSGGIELNGLLWSGAPNAGANGILVKDGGANTTLTIANATGPGATNQFAGIDIRAGIVSVGNAAQLGTAFSNITFSGVASDNATLRITDTLALSGKNGSQRLDLGDGKTATIAVDATGLLAVVGSQADALNGGVLHIGNNATLNLAAAGDVLFSGNKAAEGGAAYLETGATFNIDVAAGKTVHLGNPNRKATQLDTRLLQADTLASADDTAVINKNGVGSFNINGDNSAYKGHLNINAGTVWMNSDAILGGNVTLNGAGSTFAATTLLGNVTANAGTLLQIGDLGSIVPQTLRVGGTLALDNATLVFDAFQGSLIYRDLYTDFVEAESFYLTGINSFDINFAKLTSGVYKILTVTSGSFLDAEGNYTIPVNTVVKDTWSSTITIVGDNTVEIIVSGTTYQHNLTDIVLTSGGVSIEGKRFTANVYVDQWTSGTMVFDPENGITITGTVAVSGSIVGSGTSFDGEIISGTGSNTETPGDTLYLDVAVQNYRLVWTGSTSSAWNATDADWTEPLLDADNRFLAGDGVHFDSVSDAANEAGRTIAVTQGGVLVGEMTVSGTADYTFTGGRIDGESNRSTLEDPNRASGALEMNSTGILTLANAGNKFSGGIFINSGTVIGNAASLNENTISVGGSTALIYVQGVNDTFTGAVSGPGSVVKTGTGALTFSSIGNSSMTVGSLLIAEGAIVVTSSNAHLSVDNELTIAPQGRLVTSNTLQAGVLVNAGVLRRTTGTANTTSYIPLVGDYVGVPGGKLVVNLLDDGIGVDSLIISGNAVGTTEIVLTPSGTYANLSKPPVKREMIVLQANGINQLQIANPLGVSFYPSGTEGIGYEYTLLQGRNGTVFLRNEDAALDDINLPTIGATPLVADLLGQQIINAITERISARHEAAPKGWKAWTNYAHTLGHIRNSWYAGTDLKTNVAQVGAEYVFTDAGNGDGATLTFADTPGPGQFSAGLSYAFAQAKATRNNGSTIEAATHALNAYASWRKGPLYAGLIASYSPSSTYKARLSARDTLDSDGDVKGDRLVASLEIGAVLTIPGGGQFEPYIQASWQRNTFGDISRPDRDYSFNDPDSPNGRRYDFDDFTKTRGFVGARWSARYLIGEKFALKPWAGFGAGYGLEKAYRVRIGRQFVERDMDGTYNRFSGGFSALWTPALEAYATCQWTTGADANNLTLLGGINYRW